MTKNARWQNRRPRNICPMCSVFITFINSKLWVLLSLKSKIRLFLSKKIRRNEYKTVLKWVFWNLQCLGSLAICLVVLIPEKHNNIPLLSENHSSKLMYLTHDSVHFPWIFFRISIKFRILPLLMYEKLKFWMLPYSTDIAKNVHF